jgi:hypothetical protein
MAGRSAVPLSEHEQRLLDQIERALYAEDPKFASAVRATDPRVHARRRFWVGIVLAVLGVVVLMLSLALLRTVTVAGIPVVGVGGFLVMFAGAVLAATSWKRMTGREPLRVVGSDRPAKSKAKRGGMFDRMEDRWRRREPGGR